MVINTFIQNEVVNKVDLNLRVDSLLISNVLHLKACDWKWLALTDVIIIDGVKHTVVESDEVGYDYMVNDFTGTAIEFKLLNFHFYEGTAIDVTQVFSKISNVATEKLPMCWLAFNPLPIITKSSDVLDPFPTSVNCTIYLAGLTDYGIRHTKEHMTEVVRYLSRYAEAIRMAIKSNYIFSEDLSYSEKQLPIFGSLGKSGFVENVLDETNLSAIELKLTFNTEKECYC